MMRRRNHLKAYGLTYWAITHTGPADWLLNYRGGSFGIPHSTLSETEARIRGVSYEIVADVQYAAIKREILALDANMDVVKLDKEPKIAVYSPKTKQPWDDAVTMALTYAEIPYDVIFDDEVMASKLPEYDWLHLHHEDFTGQFGKFWSMYRNYEWYKAEVREARETSAKWGYGKVSDLKLAVAKKIREFVAGGGYLFAMCSAPDTYDIALSADNTDICAEMFDGDPADPAAQSKLHFENTFAFENFSLVTNPYEYEYSSIDASRNRNVAQNNDFFTLFTFSAKTDPIPTMLCQNHTKVIKGFMGQTTAFRKEFIKPSVLVMGGHDGLNEARYIHGTVAKGMFTFYGGHDPEDYQHHVGEPPTDLNLHPDSPGYRLILNNVLFPAAEKQKRKT